ncbi:SH3 domain-containing protein [Arboricoccus pini]|uniref:SH3 domain-containing protein n=1 Tax=Arboricoccus pini TaxID=1963835 RepID=UPI001FAF02D3|nr:SH3 domain-containing protein [Arboricoccus pini]
MVILLRRLILLIALLVTALPAVAQQKTGPSGLPLPRFASLAADRINVRTGPGKQYPIRWIYARNGLPVKIVEEFDTWRKIQDQDGDDGWVHVSLLSGRRTVSILATVAELRRTPDPDASVLLRAEPGVIGRLISCNPSACEIEIEQRRGWLERTHFWGVLPDEATLPTG